MDEDRWLVESGDDADAPSQLVCEGPSRLTSSPDSAGQTGKPDGSHAEWTISQLHSRPHLLGLDELLPVGSLEGFEAEIGDQGGDVYVLHRYVGGFHEATMVQLATTIGT